MREIEEILHIVKEGRNVLHAITRRKADRIGLSLRRNCLLKHVVEGRIEEKTRKDT